MYYIFFASAVVLYGAGLNSSTIVCDYKERLSLPLTKILFSIFFTTILTWLIIRQLLIPLSIVEFYPLVALLVYLIISVLFETVVRITTGKVTAEFGFSYLIILITLSESLRMSEVMLISVCSFISFVVLVPIVYAIKKRIDLVGSIQEHGNRKSLVLVSLAVIVTLLAVGNVSWLHAGGMQ